MGKNRDKKRRREREKAAKARQRAAAAINPPQASAHARPSAADRYFVLGGGELLGPNVASAKYASLSEPTKAVALVERIQELFDPAEIDGRMTLRRPPTPKTVQTITEEIVHMWPKGF